MQSDPQPKRFWTKEECPDWISATAAKRIIGCSNGWFYGPNRLNATHMDELGGSRKSVYHKDDVYRLKDLFESTKKPAPTKEALTTDNSKLFEKVSALEETNSRILRLLETKGREFTAIKEQNTLLERKVELLYQEYIKLLDYIKGDRN